MTFNIRNAETDKGKKSKSLRMATDLNKKPKDRSKSKTSKNKPGYKKRKKK